MHATALSAWLLNLVLYVGLTVGIAYRLWWANRRVSRLYNGSRRYSPALYTIIESGALFASATIVMVGLTAAKTRVAVAAVSPTTQLAVSEPLCRMEKAVD